MESKQMTCIRCPVGCRMTVVRKADAFEVSGHDCARGQKYALQEMTRPMRIVTSSVRVRGGVRPLCPVKTARDIPKAAIPAVLREIRAARATAPIAIGQVIVSNVAGTGVDLIATARMAGVPERDEPGAPPPAPRQGA